MSRNIVVIYDIDLAYGNGLMSHLVQRGDLACEVKLVTSYQSLEEINEDIKLLLLDESLEDMVLRDNIKQVMYLSEGKEDKLHLNRYQSMDRLTEMIKERICFNEGEKLTIGRSEIISIYSPVGGCGKTTTAKVLSQILAKRGREVYYLDFGLIPEKPKGSDANFIYDIHEGIICEQSEWNEYFTLEEGVHCMCGSLYNVGLWSLEEKDIVFLHKILREREAMYILDIGFLNQAMISIIEKCDKWILPRLSEKPDDRRVDNMKELFKFEHKEEVLNKIVEVNKLEQVELLYKEQVR